MKKKNEENNLAIDDRYVISQRKGNGELVRRVWVDTKGNVVKYSLVYINFNLFHKDNGRVIGYDNDHGYHHKHLFGKVMPISFTTFEELENQFEKEFEELHYECTEKS